MRIHELLEGRFFDDSKFVKQTTDKREIDYDLAEDLIHFMHNDDDVYRRSVYPTIAKCIDLVKAKKPTDLKLFQNSVEESYKKYLQRFPIKELPEHLDKQMCKDICEKMHEDIIQHIKDGKYEG
jgi:hypothetical protein